MAARVRLLFDDMHILHQPGASRMCVGCLLIIGLLLIPSLVAAAGSGKWWQSTEIQGALRLTPQQVAALDGTFEASLPTRRAAQAELDMYEFELEQLWKGAAPDERVAVELIDRVERARARRNVARTMLLFRMRLILTVAQRTALARIAAQ